MADRPPKWEEKTLLVATIVGAAAAVLALLPIREIRPFFELFGRSVPLWTLFPIAIVAVSVPGIVRKRVVRGPEVPESTDQLKDRLKTDCNFTIDRAKRIPEEKPNKFILSGTYDQWPPPGFKVWVITTFVGSSQPKYWPQSEISQNAAGKEWDIKIGLGSAKNQGEQMRAILALVGECSHALFKYYLSTEDPSRPGHKLPLSGLPNEVIRCKDVTLTKE